MDTVEELLPAYALDALGPEERLLVERALEYEPRYRAMLAEYQETVAQLSADHTLSVPAAALRDRIMASLPRSSRPVRLVRPVASVPLPRAVWAIAAALVIAVLGLGSLSFVQMQRVGNLEHQMDYVQREAESTDTRLRQQLALTYWISRPEASLAAMEAMSEPVDDRTQAIGMIFYRPDGVRVLMAMNLDGDKDHRAYRAWLWDKNGQALNLTSFEVDKYGYALVPLELPSDMDEMSSVSVHEDSPSAPEQPMGQAILAASFE
jgi:hypothetical protein